MSAAQPLPNRVPSIEETPIVLLGGWGMAGSALAELSTALGASGVLEHPSFDGDPGTLRARLHQWLAAALPARAVLVGWSLGGALAIDFAAAHPARVAALVTIATNPCFRSRADWPYGMDGEAFAAFRAGLVRDARAQLARFAALQAQGDGEERAVLRRLRAALASDTSHAGLLDALELLGRLDVRAQLASLPMPTLHVLGAADRLVPCALEREYLRLQPGASTWIVARAAHAPFLGRAGAVAARIRDFLAARATAQAPRHDRHEVARSFARAADAYDASARVQRLSGEALLALAPAGHRAGRVLDLGCGTGAQLGAISQRFPQARRVAADIAEGMLRATRARDPAALPCAADAEHLPFASASFDLVYSNLALQWCDAARALAEIARVLRPGGVALLATLGPDTLWELRSAWRSIDAGTHVHRLEDPARLGALAQLAGLRLERDVRLWHVERHRSVLEVAAGLRRLGAHNLAPERRRGLTGKRAWQRLATAYAELGDGGEGVPATWQIIHLVLRRTDE